MSDHLIACPMCGHQYDPAAHGACQSCPLKKGCQLVCCPACGFETVNVRQSSLARIVSRFFFVNGDQGQNQTKTIYRRSTGE